MKIKVETSQRIGRPVADVFEAWVDPGKMAGYFISKGSARMEPGKTVRWSWDDHGDAQLDIDVQSVEPDRKLVFRWSASGVPTKVSVEFRQESEGATHVTVCDDGWEADAEGIARYGEQMQGWVHMLVSLKAYLEYEQINLRHTPSEPYDLQVERSMKAAPAALFRALTQEWDRWFATPGSAIMQFKSGLPFTFDGTTETGKRYPHYGRFVRIEEDRLVELTWVTESTRGVETTLTVELTARGEGTQVRLSHSGFGDQVARDRHAVAWPDVLAHLDSYLAAHP